MRENGFISVILFLFIPASIVEIHKREILNRCTHFYIHNTENEFSLLFLQEEKSLTVYSSDYKTKIWPFQAKKKNKPKMF